MLIRSANEQAADTSAAGALSRMLRSGGLSIRMFAGYAELIWGRIVSALTVSEHYLDKSHRVAQPLSQPTLGCEHITAITPNGEALYSHS